MRCGFIGSGNMATAIIQGIISKKTMTSKDIYIFDINQEKQKELEKTLGINICLSETDLVEKCDFVFLAVKPNVLGDVLKKIGASVKKNNSKIVSIAAGKNIEFIEQNLGFDLPVIRVMPNVNALVGESMSAVCRNGFVLDDDFQTVMTIFNAVGKAVELDENYFSIFIGLSGSSPAYVYLFIDSIARAGVKAGLDKKTSLEIAAQAVLGSAKMILDSEKHPWELIDMVCSPGGTTIEGISSFLDDGFEGIVMRAVEKVISKDSKI